MNWQESYHYWFFIQSVLRGVEKYLISQGRFFFFLKKKAYGPWEQFDQSINFKFRLYFSSAVTTVANLSCASSFCLAVAVKILIQSHARFQALGILVYRRVHFGF